MKILSKKDPRVYKGAAFGNWQIESDELMRYKNKTLVWATCPHNPTPILISLSNLLHSNNKGCPKCSGKLLRKECSSYYTIGDRIGKWIVLSRKEGRLALAV